MSAGSVTWNSVTPAAISRSGGPGTLGGCYGAASQVSVATSAACLVNAALILSRRISQGSLRSS